MSDKPFVPISLNTEALEAALARIEQASGDLTPLMVSLRQELLAQTEENFGAQGRPAWPALAEVTTAARQKIGRWPGQLLQVHGMLASGLVSHSDATSALIGVSDQVPYGPIQQFGGQAGVNRKVAIPARPYLPMRDAHLQPEAQAALLALAQDYLLAAVTGSS